MTDPNHRISSGKDDPNLTIFGVSEENFDSPLIKSWSILSLTSTSLEIKVEFSDPIEVSQGSKPDILVVLIELSTFIDVNG